MKNHLKNNTKQIVSEMPQSNKLPMWICIDGKIEGTGYCYIYMINDNLYMIEEIYEHPSHNNDWHISDEKEFMTYEEMEEHLHNRFQILYYNPEQKRDKIEFFKAKYLYPPNEETTNEDPSSDESEDPSSD